MARARYVADITVTLWKPRLRAVFQSEAKLVIRYMVHDNWRKLMYGKMSVLF